MERGLPPQTSAVPSVADTEMKEKFDALLKRFTTERYDLQYALFIKNK